MANIVTDLSVNLDFNVRDEVDNSCTFTFTSTNISTYTFSLQVRNFGNPANVLNLTEGAGLTNGGASTVLTVALTAANMLLLVNDDYYWQLKVVHPDGTTHLWFNGTFHVFDELYEGDISTSVTSTINLAGTDVDVTISLPGGGAGSSTFIGLTDVPATYTGQTLKLVRVNAGETALEFVAAGAGTGDVVGPASAVDSRIVLFDTTSGKLIKDSGTLISGLVPTSRTVNDIALTGDIVIPSPIIYRFSGRHYGSVINQGAALSHVIGANSIRAYPFIVEKNLTFNAIRTEVISAVGGTTYRIAIYTTNGAGYPDALVADTDVAEYDSASTGVKLGTPSGNVTLTPGAYRFVLLANGAPTLRGFASATVATMLGSFVTIGAAPNITEQRAAQAYGAMPATYPAGATEFSNNSPVVLLTIV